MQAALLILPACFLSISAASGNDSLSIEWSSESVFAGGARGGVLQLHSGEVLAARTHWGNEEVAVICSRSEDGGKTWSDISTIARERAPADLGDGHLIQLPDGEVLFSYRHHKYPENNHADGTREYSVRVVRSTDNGKSWEPHSVVATSRLDSGEDPGAKRGLWSSFLLLRSDGALQCYFDDEDTPHRNGFRRHQWLTMKTWQPESGRWENPVTVSRAHSEKNLSRDGMPGVLELPDGRLLCAFESVQTSPPHANCIRMVTSDDGGESWSWEKKERDMLFEPPGDHLAVSPWLLPLGEKEFLAVFATDEDRENPGVSGTPVHELQMDIKYVVSLDSGKTWTKDSRALFAATHRSYLPGVLRLNDGRLLATFIDFSLGGERAVHGKVLETD